MTFEILKMLSILILRNSYWCMFTKNIKSWQLDMEARIYFVQKSLQTDLTLGKSGFLYGAFQERKERDSICCVDGRELSIWPVIVVTSIKEIIDLLINSHCCIPHFQLLHNYSYLSLILKCLCIVLPTSKEWCSLKAISITGLAALQLELMPEVNPR